MPRLRHARTDDPAAQPLLAGLAEEYARLYGEGADGELTTREVHEFVPPHGVFLLAVDRGETVAGGGLAPLAAGTAEVKRMWTAPGHRGRGLARRILVALEREAVGLGYRVLRLQTGSVAVPAVRLYETAGFHRIEPFGRYRDEPLAVAFEKRVG